MKILWLATDRSNRVADIFGPLQREVSKIADVQIINRNLGKLMPKRWQKVYTTGKQKPPKIVKPRLANECDFIMIDAPFAFLNEGWDKIKTKRGLLIEDQHGDVLRYSKMYRAHRFDVFFTRYSNILKRHPWLKDQTIKWLPHSFDPKTFKDYNSSNKWDALMVGRIHDAFGSTRIYPIRWKAHEQMSQSGFPTYHQVERPPEGVNPKLRYPSGKEYAELINSSKITFTDMSTFNYQVLKFFEIPACKSALFSDYDEDLGKLGFIPDVNMVSLNKTSYIPNIVNKWLDSPKKLKELTQNGYDMVHEKHTAAVRARELVDYLENQI